jgi:hypothetical protein
MCISMLISHGRNQRSLDDDGKLFAMPWPEASGSLPMSASI